MGRRNQQQYGRRRADTQTTRSRAPEFGARHRVVWDDSDETLTDFFAHTRYILDGVDGKEGIVPRHTEGNRYGKALMRPAFHLHEDPDKAWITIMERRLPQRHRARKKLDWTSKDIGRMKQDIANETSRLELSRFTLSVTMSNVVQLGQGSRTSSGRVLGLIPDQASCETQLFVAENEIVTRLTTGGENDERAGPMAEAAQTESNFIPHMTILRLYKEVSPRDTSRSIEAIQNLLPLTVQVEPLSMYSEIGTA